jgi:hypothetical protein
MIAAMMPQDFFGGTPAMIGNLPGVIEAYLAILVIFSVLAIWGFKLGSDGPGGKGGGGRPKRRPPRPSPPGGPDSGDERPSSDLDLSRLVGLTEWDEQVPEPERERVGADELV